MILAHSGLVPWHFLLIVVSFSTVFLLLRFMTRLPSARRAAGQHVHYVGVIVIAVMALLATLVVPDAGARAGLLAAALAIGIFGTLDERLNLSPLSQLLAQIGITLVVVLSGWLILYVTHPAGAGILYLTWVPLWGTFSLGALLVTVAWLVFIMNSVNWLDGSDGLAGSVAAVAFITLAAVSVLPASQHGQSLALALIGLGATAAFLLWNWPPARVYLGTSGSWWLGLYLGLAAIASGKIVTTLIVLAWPAIDAISVIAQRALLLRPPWRGDAKSHLHHRLLVRGVKPSAVAMFAASLSAIAGATVLWLQTNQLRAARGCPDFSRATVALAAQRLSVALAIHPDEQTHGLSGCPVVPPDSGLYFSFTTKEPRTFWMRGMLIPIDIIWLADGRVIGVAAHVPPPAALAADAALPLYRSPQPADAVLELAAGEAGRLSITPGTSVRLLGK
ncbi:MAG: DUF192 domain-containing protein [Candidatus Andersenbacteria bacterium]|nr:DUF192 domain-containing protein [Candidatus Andersenbacteria bacterium]